MAAPAAAFLDRDGTLITNTGDLGDPEGVELVAGAAAAMARLADAGLLPVVVTNQGGVARGAFTEDDVRAVHARLAALVDAATGRRGLLAHFYYCPFHPEGTVPRYRREHPWRKPAPGMLLAAAADLGLDLARSWMIGDAARDVEAGRAAGCRTVLLAASAPPDVSPTLLAPALAEAAGLILRP